jgi:hypothetical protein
MWFAFYLAGFAAYLLIAAIASLIASGFATKARRAKIGWGVFAAFVALPVGDAALSSIYFNILCKAQGGIEISERFDKIDGYLLEGQTYIPDGMLLKSPYEYIEARQGKIKRYTKTGDETVTVKNVAAPKSLFKVQYVHEEYPFNIGKTELQIISIQDDRIVAKKTAFAARMTTFRPWLEKDPCPFFVTDGTEFVQEVLKGN